MFRRYQDTSCWTNCECEFGFLAGRISAIRFQSTVLLDLQGEGRLISCARKKKIEHVATSRLPGRWGSLDSSSAYSSASAPLLLAFFRQLVVTMDINIVPDLAASASSSDEIHGPGDYISSCLARTRPNTLASTAQAVDTCGSEPYLELQVTLGTYGPEHAPERRPE